MSTMGIIRGMNAAARGEGADGIVAAINSVPRVVDSATSVITGIGRGSPTLDNGYDFREYVEGLFSSVGAEQELNRLYNSEQAKLNRDFQSAEAAIQRDWYESMANSSYQRSVNDLMKAGLNPVLAVSQGGASASVSGIPQGSNASVSGAQGDTLSSLLNAIASVASSVADFLPNISKVIRLKK